MSIFFTQEAIFHSPGQAPAVIICSPEILLFPLEIESVSVRIRMKRLGRKGRPFYRLCAIDQRSPRDGRVLEELGHYDPMCRETDARAILKGERIDYWVSVGAQPSENVQILIKKYGTNGTHLAAQQEALTRLGRIKVAKAQA